MEMLEILGIALSIWATIFGLGGAVYTAQASQKARNFGFKLWLINSPGMVLSLIGIAAGWWTGLSAWALVPLNIVYLYTAYIGFKTTSVTIVHKADEEYQGA